MEVSKSDESISGGGSFLWPAEETEEQFQDMEPLGVEGLVVSPWEESMLSEVVGPREDSIQGSEEMQAERDGSLGSSLDPENVGVPENEKEDSGEEGAEEERKERKAEEEERESSSAPEVGGRWACALAGKVCSLPSVCHQHKLESPVTQPPLGYV